jgi:hypothetical protein
MKIPTQLFFDKSTPISHNGLLKFKTMDWSIDWNGRNFLKIILYSIPNYI